MRRSLRALVIGVEALRAHPLRTALATLGVVIGVAALVAVLALADGMERYGRDQVARTTGLQTVEIAPRLTREVEGVELPSADYPIFTADDASAAARLPGVDAVGLAATTTVILEGGPARGRRGALVIGALAGAADFSYRQVRVGRFFTAAEERRGADVLVLSHGLAARLAAPYPPEALLEQRLRAGSRMLRVVGIFEPLPVGQDAEFAYVPLGLVEAVSAPGVRPAPPTLALRARSLEEVPAVRTQAEDWLAARDSRWHARVTVTTSEARLAQLRDGMRVFRLGMGAITGVSLLVGGIGIMNVLLASVVERTREIGTRRAVGARRRDVLAQFLTESVAIAVAGSVAGVALGLAGVLGVAALARRAFGQALHTVPSWTTVGAAVAAATIIGLVFGTYPALRAARLSPIDAIRHE
jgi:putative ABC transport system permease protein